jgi:hypothetical protein
MDFLKNTWLLWISLVVITLGFVTLKAGMLSVGPILLVAGYCLGVPLFIWRTFRQSVQDESGGE